jgi:hypothetical protein
MGSQLTNVLRCLYLEANGYQVTVTELVGWEHSMKNELILARRTGQRSAARRAPAGAAGGVRPRSLEPVRYPGLPATTSRRPDGVRMGSNTIPWRADPDPDGSPAPSDDDGGEVPGLTRHHIIQRGNNRQAIS